MQVEILSGLCTVQHDSAVSKRCWLQLACGHLVQAVCPPTGSLVAAFLRQLNACVQVDILCSLCTDLLDLNTIKAEINRREQRGQFVAGKGGIGGANPVRTDAQRVKRMAPPPQVCSLRTS